jgi:hypothetical protein
MREPVTTIVPSSVSLEAGLEVAGSASCAKAGATPAPVANAVVTTSASLRDKIISKSPQNWFPNLSVHRSQRLAQRLPTHHNQLFWYIGSYCI